MARDYKDRANRNSKKPQQIRVAWWKWVLIIVLISLFVSFLFFLGDSEPELEPKQQTKSISIATKTTKVKPAPKKPKHQDKKPQEPQFDFYTILPETEIVVPDYEISTRSREEKFGKRKAQTNKYILQAGSFKDFSQADRLRARLALMGIESRVEKASIGSVVWNRVKIGPYTRSSKVSVIKKRLRNSGIDVIVTEVKG